MVIFHSYVSLPEGKPNNPSPFGVYTVSHGTMLAMTLQKTGEAMRGIGCTPQGLIITIIMPTVPLT